MSEHFYKFCNTCDRELRSPDEESVVIKDACAYCENYIEIPVEVSEDD